MTPVKLDGLGTADKEPTTARPPPARKFLARLETVIRMENGNPRNNSVVSKLVAAIVVMTGLGAAILYHHHHQKSILLNDAKNNLFVEYEYFAIGTFTITPPAIRSIDYDRLKLYPNEIAFEALKNEIDMADPPGGNHLFLSEYTEGYYFNLVVLMLNKFGDDGVDHLLKLYSSRPGRFSRIAISNALAGRVARGHRHIAATLMDGLRHELDESILKAIGKNLADSFAIADKYAMDNPAPGRIHEWLTRNIQVQNRAARK